MDLPIPLFSGSYPVDVNAGYGYEKRVFFRQYDPLPTTILAIIPKITIGG
jgi:hypothetical protein